MLNEISQFFPTFFLNTCIFEFFAPNTFWPFSLLDPLTRNTGFYHRKNKHRGFFISSDSLRIQSTFRTTKNFQKVFKTWKEEETSRSEVKRMKIVNIFHGHFRESDFTVVGKICDKLIKVRTSTKLMNMINLVKLFFFSRVNLQNDANAVIVIFHSTNRWKNCQVYDLLISTFDLV